MILSLESLKEQIPIWKINRKTIVFTNGCFDLLHKGHLDLLKSAKGLGDYLVVGLNSDKSVKGIKGPERPRQDQNSRVNSLIKTSLITAIIVFDQETPIDLIKLIKPDFLVKGADYDVNKIVGADFVISNGGQVKTIDLTPGFSTTKLIKKNDGEILD